VGPELWRTVEPVRSGGQPRTSGWDSSTSRGMHLEALYGGFDGEPLDDDSRKYVFVTRRQAPPGLM
jgi:hypothetical protein